MSDTQSMGWVLLRASFARSLNRLASIRGLSSYVHNTRVLTLQGMFGLETTGGPYGSHNAGSQFGTHFAIRCSVHRKCARGAERRHEDHWEEWAQDESGCLCSPGEFARDFETRNGARSFVVVAIFRATVTGHEVRVLCWFPRIYDVTFWIIIFAERVLTELNGAQIGSELSASENGGIIENGILHHTPFTENRVLAIL